MRLVVVTNDYPPKLGGIQQYLGSFVAAWPHPVRVLGPEVTPSESAGDSDLVSRGPHRFMWPTPGVARWVTGEVADFGADVVLFGAPYPLPSLGPGLRKHLGVPFAVLAHGAEVLVPSALPGVRQVFAAPLRSADALLAVSGFTQRKLARLTKRTVDFVGAGVDIAAFAPRTWTSSAVPVVGCVSRFVPRKGQHRLIEAAATLRDAGRPVQLLMVGRGRTEGALRRLAAQRGVDVRFEIGVPWAELPDRYAQMDIFCMPCRSRWAGLEAEGLGLVFLEAAAVGLPVLAGDSGGSSETVLPGRTGFVVHSTSDIVEGIEYLLDDPLRARAMGAAGRTRIEQEFTWEAVVKRVESVLGAVV